MNVIRRATTITAARATSKAGATEASQEELAKVLPFLFAVRWGAWAIAWVIVWVGHLSKVNSSHEPVLLAVTFTEILGTTLYIPLLRSRVRRAFGTRLGPRDDLIVLGLLGVAVALIVTYYSGGWSSPYYHYGLASLLVPAFLLGWRRSVLLLAGFLGAYLLVLSTAGRGLDGTWVDEDIAAIIMTPALVIVVVQYLAQLTRRLDQQRAQAQRSLLETSALYRVAQTVATADRPETLMAHVVETLEGLSRFEGLAVLLVSDDGALSLEAGFGATVEPEARLSAEQLQTLSQPDGVVRLSTPETPHAMLLVPIHVQERLWGVVAWRARSDAAEQADLRLVQAVAGQLSLGLTKIALSRQKEELAAQEERSRIAREIHDGIAQSIYMLSLNLEKAAEVARDDARLGQRLGGLVGLAKEALLEVRHYIFDLKPLLAGDASLAEHHPRPDAGVQRRLRPARRAEGGRRGAERAAGGRELALPDHAGGAGQRLPARRREEHRGAARVQRRRALAGDPRRRPRLRHRAGRRRRVAGARPAQHPSAGVGGRRRCAR